MELTTDAGGVSACDVSEAPRQTVILTAARLDEQIWALYRKSPLRVGQLLPVCARGDWTCGYALFDRRSAVTGTFAPGTQQISILVSIVFGTTDPATSAALLPF